MRLLVIFSSLSLAIFSQLAVAKPCDLEISYQRLDLEKEVVITSLLNLALSKTKYTPCYVQRKKPLSLAREVFEVSSGRLRLMWSGTSPIAETHLRAIRIPVFRGLLGTRLLIIRKEDQAKFKQVMSLDALRKFKAGSGELWADRFALESADIPVTTTAFGTQLWPMLRKKRFDYMPFGIFEAWQHFPKNSDILDIESSLVIHYPIAFYFYVNNDDDVLYKAIYEGMERAINDGSYDKHLFGTSLMQKAIKNTDIQSRRIIRLDNPILPTDTPFHRNEFWLDPLSIDKFFTD